MKEKRKRNVLYLFGFSQAIIIFVFVMKCGEKYRKTEKIKSVTQRFTIFFLFGRDAKKCTLGALNGQNKYYSMVQAEISRVFKGDRYKTQNRTQSEQRV